MHSFFSYSSLYIYHCTDHKKTYKKASLTHSSLLFMFGISVQEAVVEYEKGLNLYTRSLSMVNARI